MGIDNINSRGLIVEEIYKPKPTEDDLLNRQQHNLPNKDNGQKQKENKPEMNEEGKGKLIDIRI